MGRNWGCGSGKRIFLIGGEVVEHNRPVLEALGNVTHQVRPLGACRRAWAVRTWRPSPGARRAGRGPGTPTGIESQACPVEVLYIFRSAGPASPLARRPSSAESSFPRGADTPFGGAQHVIRYRTGATRGLDPVRAPRKAAPDDRRSPVEIGRARHLSRLLTDSAGHGETGL